MQELFNAFRYLIRYDIAWRHAERFSSLVGSVSAVATLDGSGMLAQDLRALQVTPADVATGSQSNALALTSRMQPVIA